MKTYSFKKNDKGEISVTSQKSGRKLHIVSLVVCFLLAVIVWLYVAGNDPGSTKNITTELQIVGAENLIDDSGMMVYLPGTMSVTVTLHGQERLLRNITEADVKTYIDVSAVTTQGVSTLPIAVEFAKYVNPSIEVAGLSLTECEVLVDSEATKQVPIVVKCSTEGVDLIPHPTVLELQGPATLINTIELAQCTIYRDVRPTETLRSQKYVFMDVYGNTINNKFFQNVTADVSTISVQVVAKETGETD